MKYRPYLEGGIEVSELGFGAWQLGVESGWSAVSDAESERMIRTALDHGINFFDTAPTYGKGTSEERLGKVLGALDRGSFVVNSKFGRLHNGEVDFSAGLIRETVEGSLKRLRVDCLDSVIIHSPPRELLDGNKTDHYAILERLQEEGKIRAYGASIDFAEEITTLLETTGAKVIQSFFNILHQDCKGAFDLVQEKGATVIAKIPFDSGWLTGKYSATSRFTGVRARWSEDEIRQRAQLVDRVKEIVGDAQSLMPAALSFCTSFDSVSTVIPGAVSVAQLLANIEAIQHRLDGTTRAALDAFYEEEVRPLQLPW
jgi:aryl-alcohol dehydrogenase-like predicted oxidoreductase